VSYPERGSTEMPVFAGVGQVINLVRRLVRRPRLGEAPFGPRMGRRRARRLGIPMVCLVRESARSFLPTLAAGYLDAARPGRIPHALHRCPDEPQSDLAPGDVVSPPTIGEVPKVRDILFVLSRELVSGRNAKFGRIRFRRFGLVYWLMDQSLTPNVKDPDRLLREKLRERDIVVRPDERILAATTESVSSVVTIPAWGRRLMAVIPPLWFSLKVSGRLPVVSSPYRWFLRGQPNLAPQDPGTFVGFAERLTRENYSKEDPEQVMRLLVNSFLEDLRRAYGRWPWRLAGARRMTYVVVLLDGITRTNGGYRLLELINDVRNETGAFDPLLMVSGSQKVPPYAVEPGGANPEVAVWDARNAEQGYAAWRNQFSRDSRRRAPTAWYLPIRIPDDAGADANTLSEEARENRRRSYVAARQELAAVEDFTIDRPPLWSRRWIPGIAVIALAATLGVVGFDYRQRHCGELPGSSGAAWLTTVGDECIGVSDGSHVFQPTNSHLAAVEQKVHEQNLQAAEQHKASPGRPYVTLVYVSTVTSTDHPPDELVSARERLEGVAVAQARQLALTGPNEPIVRVLIANGGTSMAHGVTMAETIVRMAASDPSIAGVVGLHQSRQPTVDTISAISKAGLPMVAATLSADKLLDSSSLYFQVSPQNVREAAVAAAYTSRKLMKDGHDQHRYVRILASADPADYYSANLAHDVAQAFGHSGFTVDPVKFNPQGFTPQGKQLSYPSATTLAERACGYDGMIFFAGRQEDFEELLNGFWSQCRKNPPQIIGDDDVARYVADKTKREKYSEIPYYYLSFAVNQGSKCAYDDVYKTLGNLFPQECELDRDPSLDGSMEMAYDATLAMIKAATHLRQDHDIPVTPGGLWRELSALSLDGESGRIDFGKGSIGRVPVNKSIAVLRVKNGHLSKNISFCGQHMRLQSENWCPLDSAGQTPMP